MSTPRRARPPHVSAAAIAVTVALAVALLLVLTGCSDPESGEAADSRSTPAADSAPSKGTGQDTAPEGGSELAPAGEVLATVQGDEDMVAKITKVERTSAWITITAVMQNTGTEKFLPVGWKDETGRKPYTLANSFLEDPKALLRYWVLVGEEGVCSCSFQLKPFEPGESTETYVRFPALPKDVSKVSVKIATFPPFDLTLPEGE